MAGRGGGERGRGELWEERGRGKRWEDGEEVGEDEGWEIGWGNGRMSEERAWGRGRGEYLELI